MICLSCGGVAPIGSETLQLTAKDFSCTQYTAEEISTHLQEMPPQMLDTSSFTQSSPEQVKNQLTGIPQPLLEYLYGRTNEANFSISEARLNRGILGLTTLRGFSGLPFEPSSIQIAAVPGAVNFALQHEVGHAVESQVKKRELQENQRRWNKAFQEGVNNTKLRNYAKQSPGEYFAEAFANYYCSPEAQQFIAQELPTTFKHLRNLLPPARWEESQNAPSTPTPRRLSEDTFVFIEPAPSDEVYVYVSGPKQVKNIDLCLESRAECLERGTWEPSFKLAEKQLPDRVILKSQKAIALRKDMQMTITSLDDRGRKLGTRSIMVKKRT